MVRPNHRFLRRRQQSGLARKLEAKVLRRIADNENTWVTLSGCITTMTCKRSRQNPRGSYSIFLPRRVRWHNDTIGHSRPGSGMSFAAICMHWRKLTRVLPCASVLLFAAAANGQIQVDLKFKRLQYIAYEPVVATLAITNLAGRDIELHDSDRQSWLGFEVTGNEGQSIAPLNGDNDKQSLKIEAGQRVTRQIALAALYPVHDFGAYHVRAHVYFPDLATYSYSGTRV